MSISDNSDTETGATFEETVEAFDRFLDPKGATEQDEDLEQEDAEDDESEAQDDLTEEDAQEDDESDEAEDEKVDQDDEAAEGAPLDLNRKVSVKIDGQTMEVPLSEVLNGYQRQSDYSRKTQALAQERNQFLQEVQQVRQERQQYAYVIQQLSQELQQKTQQQPDWQQLYENDPIEYLRQKDLFRDNQARMQAAQAEQARLQQMQAHEEMQQWKSHVQTEREQMLEMVPAWRDPKVFQRDRAAIIEYGLSQGFSREELQQASDHRAVIALYNSMKQHKLSTAKPKAAAARPVENSPKVMTNQGKAPKGKADNLTKAKQRLSRSGSIEDAAEIFKHLL